MDFYAVLDQIVDLLRQCGRVTYNALKRQFNLDEAFLADVKDELIAAQRLAVDEDGKVLVWIGGVVGPTSLPADRPQPAPLSYTPQHLTDKILASPHCPGGRA